MGCAARCNALFLGEAMTAMEKALVLEAAYWLSCYEDSNPDVGIGPMNVTFIHRIIKKVGIPATMEEILTLTKELGDRRK